MGLLPVGGKERFAGEMSWIGRGLKDHLIPTPLPWTENLLVGQVTQNSIQPGLEHFLRWGVHNLSRQPGLMPHCLIVKNFFLINKSTLLQVKAIHPCLVTMCTFTCHENSPSSAFL